MSNWKDIEDETPDSAGQVLIFHNGVVSTAIYDNGFLDLETREEITGVKKWSDFPEELNDSPIIEELKKVIPQKWEKTGEDLYVLKYSNCEIELYVGTPNYLLCSISGPGLFVEHEVQDSFDDKYSKVINGCLKRVHSTKKSATEVLDKVNYYPGE